MNNELGKVLKEAVVVYSKILSQNLLRGREESHKTLSEKGHSLGLESKSRLLENRLFNYSTEKFR